MIKYRVEYEGQILTEPLSFEEALVIAVEENIDAFKNECLPLCEVAIASSKVCSQCVHFVSFVTTAREQCDGACFLFMDSAGSGDTIAAICKGYKAGKVSGS